MYPHPDYRMWPRRSRLYAKVSARQGGPLDDLTGTSTEINLTSLFSGLTSTLRVISQTSNTSPVLTPTTTPTAVGSVAPNPSNPSVTPSPTPTPSEDPEPSDTWESAATSTQAANTWDSDGNQPTTQWTPTETTPPPVQTTTQLETTTLVSVSYTVSAPASSDITTTPSAPNTTATPSPDESGAQPASRMLLTGTEIAALCAGAAAILVFSILLWWGVRRCKRGRSDAVEVDPEFDPSWPGRGHSPVTIVPDVEAAFNRNYDVPSQVSPVHSTSHFAETSTRVDTLESIGGDHEDKEETFRANSSRESLIAEEPSVRSSSTLSYINTLCPETAQSPSTTAAARALPPVPSYNHVSQPPHLGPPYHSQAVGVRPLPLPVPSTPFASMYVPEERASLDSAAYGSVEATVSVYSVQDGGVVRCTGGVYAESADGQPPEYSRY